MFSGQLNEEPRVAELAPRLLDVFGAKQDQGDGNPTDEVSQKPQEDSHQPHLRRRRSAVNDFTCGASNCSQLTCYARNLAAGERILVRVSKLRVVVC